GRLRPTFGWRGARQLATLARARLDRADRFARWRLMLAAGTPWTEYALYYTLLEAKGRLERFHTVSDRPISDEARSIWRAGRVGFASWNAAPYFEGAGPPWFVVVQSNTKIPASSVWRKIEPFID